MTESEANRRFNSTSEKWKRFIISTNKDENKKITAQNRDESIKLINEQHEDNKREILTKVHEIINASEKKNNRQTILTVIGFALMIIGMYINK